MLPTIETAYLQHTMTYSRSDRLFFHCLPVQGSSPGHKIANCVFVVIIESRMSFGDIYLAALNHLEARRRADAITLLCHTAVPSPEHLIRF